MSRPFEIFLREKFNLFSLAYVESFPRAYRARGLDESEFGECLEAYVAVIEAKCEPIYRIAAALISSYLNMYNVHANQSVDEYKITYFLGRAIERHLVSNGLLETAQVHMYAMVGLLDFRLRVSGYYKPLLTKAMTKLIRVGKFDDELGLTGCYLTYKCVSTSSKLPTPGL